MSLRDLAAKGFITQEPTSPPEIAELIAMADRDLQNASVEGLDPDWQFAIAYQAVLHLATAVMRAEGWRPAGSAHHYATLAALGEIAGRQFARTVVYFQTCRTKRNSVSYERVGQITSAEVAALLQAAADLRPWTLRWLARNHPQLVPPEPPPFATQ
jgi:hypothetical protein